MTLPAPEISPSDAPRPAGKRPPKPELSRLFDRLPPHSPEVEMSLLGTMILDPKVIVEVRMMIPSSDFFYNEKHSAIYDALLQTHEFHQGGDLVLLSTALRDKGLLDDVGGEDYLLGLAQNVPSATNWQYYAKVVRESARLRQLILAAGDMMYSAYGASSIDPQAAQSVLDSSLGRIFDIAGDVASLNTETLAEMLEKTLDMLVARTGRSITGIATGFYDLDELTSGLQKGEMIIVAARPSMGKTAFALNLAEQVAFGGSPHDEKGPHTPAGFFSMEMSNQSVVQRLLSAHSGVDSHKMRRNILNQDDFRSLAISCGKLAEAPLYIDDTPGLTISMLEGKARRMVRQHKIRCMFVDYLQLMTAPFAAKENRQMEVSAISRGIKALAQKLQIPIVCLAQLNRAAEQREGNRPRMADLRESGSLEQDADVVMLLHREEYYHLQSPTWAEENPDKVGIAEIIIAKQRNGPTGTVELRWNASTTRFQNLARGYGGHAPVVTRPAQPSSTPRAPAAREGPAAFAPGAKSGPITNHRDGGGPEREQQTETPPWADENIDDIPI